MSFAAKAAGKPTVLCYGHYDVQPPDPLEEWVSPPFDPVVRDGNIYARGAADDKGQVLTYLLAAEADKIQDLLFRSARLREVAGGSQLLTRFCDETPSALGVPEKDVITGKKVITKLKNASRFVFMNLTEYDHKDITLASLILLFALVALPFLFINLFGGPFAFDALILMSPLFIIIIGFPFIELLSAIKTYHSAEEFYQKLKEQEENGQIKCPVCEKKTAVLVKKQDSTFIVCKRCGFAWFYKSLLLLPHDDAVRILSGEFRVESEKVHEKCPRTGEMKNKPDECRGCEYLMYKAVMDKAGCKWTLWKCTFEKREGE